MFLSIQDYRSREDRVVMISVAKLSMKLYRQTYLSKWSCCKVQLDCQGEGVLQEHNGEPSCPKQAEYPVTIETLPLSHGVWCLDFELFCSQGERREVRNLLASSGGASGTSSAVHQQVL